MWSKGTSGNPTGRPKGSKNKDYLRVETWLAAHYRDMEKSQVQERIKIQQAVLTHFFSKMQILPGDPNDSLTNADAILQRKKALEQQTQNDESIIS